ncbi:MAG: hypothetical protein K9H64_23550, partial [Bacteroidales bacterium]|nr:hypothetical protein [Bacteroidales bacterium]
MHKPNAGTDLQFLPVPPVSAPIANSRQQGGKEKSRPTFADQDLTMYKHEALFYTATARILSCGLGSFISLSEQLC